MSLMRFVMPFAMLAASVAPALAAEALVVPDAVEVLWTPKQIGFAFRDNSVLWMSPVKKTLPNACKSPAVEKLLAFEEPDADRDAIYAGVPVAGIIALRDVLREDPKDDAGVYVEAYKCAPAKALVCVMTDLRDSSAALKFDACGVVAYELLVDESGDDTSD